MLPGPLLALLWFATAVVLPLLQTLHALQLRSDERRDWLLYWVCYAACSWVPGFVEGIIQLPFYVLGALVVDVYYEARLLTVFWLVCPRTGGLLQLRQTISAEGSRLTAKALEAAPAMLGAALRAPAGQADAPASPEKDGPGTYTVIKEAGIMPTMETAKGHVVAHLNVGDVIEVLEVVNNAEEQRVRARVAACGDKPPGWISLHSGKTGTRWAVRGVQKPGVFGGSNASEVFANAAAAGCDPSALWTGGSGTAVPTEVSDEDAWEAMALLESQLSRADDASEGAAAQQAAVMLRQMLTTLTQTGNPAMLGMAQAMMPDLGKIWANETTKAYLTDLLAAQPGGPVAGAGTSVAAESGASPGQHGGGSGSAGASGAAGGSAGAAQASGSAGSAGAS